MNGLVRGRFRGLRVWFMVAFAWPLLFKLPIAILLGQGRGLLGAALGLGLLVLAALRMQGGRAGDTRRGAIMIGVAAGLIAGLSANLFPPVAVLLAFGAWAGARLLSDDIVEEVPPPEPEPVVIPTALEEAQSRIAALRGRLTHGAALPLAAQIGTAATALDGLLREIASRPDHIPEARRFLSMQLDGLNRVMQRLERGAEPPATLAPLLDGITVASDDWRQRHRAAESAALDIQVKVMGDRLREDGR